MPSRELDRLMAALHAGGEDEDEAAAQAEAEAALAAAGLSAGRGDLAAYSVGVATPTRSISILRKTEKSVERLYDAMRTTENEMEEAMRFSSEVHRHAYEQKDLEMSQLKQLLVAKERTIDSLRDTLASSKRTLEAKVAALSTELAARDSQLDSERRRSHELVLRVQQAESLAQAAVDAAQRNEEAREAQEQELKHRIRELKKDNSTLRDETAANTASLRHEETVRRAVEKEAESERRKFQREVHKLQKKALAEDALIDRLSELESKLSAERKSRRANEKWLEAELKTKEEMEGLFLALRDVALSSKVSRKSARMAQNRSGELLEDNQRLRHELAAVRSDVGRALRIASP